MLAYWRTTPGEPPVLVAINFAAEPVQVRIPASHQGRRIHLEVVDGTHVEPALIQADGRMELRALEGVVARRTVP